MIRIQQIISVFTILLLISGFSYAANLQEGFLGTKWGADIKELKGLKKIFQKGDVSYYRNPQIAYSIFDLDTEKVTLGFFRDKFFAAYAEVESITVFDRVKSHLTQRFGSPTTIVKTQNQQTIYRWKYEKIKTKLKIYEEKGKMKLAFYYNPLAAKVNEVQRELFPPMPTDSLSMDEGTRREDMQDLKLKRRMDVFGF
jgi:hypothetical protein